MPTFTEGSSIGEPDIVFELEEEYFIEGNNLDDYRVFVFPTNFTEDIYIKIPFGPPLARRLVWRATKGNLYCTALAGM